MATRVPVCRRIERRLFWNNRISQKAPRVEAPNWFTAVFGTYAKAISRSFEMRFVNVPTCETMLLKLLNRWHNYSEEILLRSKTESPVSLH
jgi:hypothetical protein